MGNKIKEKGKANKGLVKTFVKTYKQLKELMYLEHNLVYSEIILKVNTQKVFLFKFQKKFKKSRIALLEQVENLIAFGILKEEVKGRKRLFYIDWGKINEMFVCFLLDKIVNFEDYLEKDYKNSFFDKEGGRLLIKKCKYNELKNEKRQKEIINNPYLTDFFKTIFKSLDEQKHYITLHSLFEYIIRRVEIDKNNKILFSCLDYFKKYDLIKGIPTKDISEKEKYDFFVFLPLVFNDINKDWKIEQAFGNQQKKK